MDRCRKRAIELLALLLIFMVLLLGCGEKAVSDLDELLSLGQKYLQEENYKEAVIVFKKAIKIDEKCVEAYLGLAESYLGLGDQDAAMDILKLGYEKTKDEGISSKIKELEGSNTGGPSDVGNEQIHLNIKNDAEGTFFLTLTDLPEFVRINNESTNVDDLEYEWIVSFSDGEKMYEIGTMYFMSEFERQKGSREAELPTDQCFQHNLWTIDNSGGGDLLEDVNVSRNMNTLSWNFKMPEDALALYNIKYIGYRCTTNGETNMAAFKVKEDGKSLDFVGNCSISEINN